MELAKNCEILHTKNITRMEIALSLIVYTGHLTGSGRVFLLGFILVRI